MPRRHTLSTDKAREAEPERLPARRQRDARLSTEIRRVWEENFRLYGVRKVYRQLHREAIPAARCTVARLMRATGIRGVVRGQPPRTTMLGEAAPSALDHVQRDFQAERPDAPGKGVDDEGHVDEPLDALEQALHQRAVGKAPGLVHHSDRGVQYVSIRYTDWLAEAGIEPSVGSVGDSHDNALAESINGLYKTEVNRHCGPWPNLESVAFATLEWVEWYNNRRIMESIGNRPPAEVEAEYYEQLTEWAQAA